MSRCGRCPHGQRRLYHNLPQSPTLIPQLAPRCGISPTGDPRAGDAVLDAVSAEGCGAPPPGRALRRAGTRRSSTDEKGGLPMRRPPQLGRGWACKPGSVTPSRGPLVIYLGRASPRASSGRLEMLASRAGSLSLSDLAPGGVCLAAPVTRDTGALLPHPFTLAGARRRLGGLLSVALSLGSPPPGVTRHRVSVEPGLSSPGLAAEGGHPADWR